MKPFLFTAAFLFALNLAYCQVPEVTKAHQNISNYLHQHLHDADSYRSVGWGKILKVDTDFDSTGVAAIYNRTIEKFMLIKNQLHDVRFNKELKTTNQAELNNDTNYVKAGILMHKDDSVINELKIEKLKAIEKAQKAFKSKLDHFVVEHTFRARNGYNAVRLNTWTFILNKSMQVVEVETESIQEQAEQLKLEQDKILQAIEDLKNKYQH